MPGDADRTVRPFTIDDATALLARTPALLTVWLRDLPDAWLRAHEGGDTWSPFDIVGHLIHGERTDWIPRVRRIIEQGESQAFDRFDRTAMFEHSRGETIGTLLEAFAALRADNLATLGAMGLTAADLDRTGRHPELGVVTLRQLLATWVAHDLDHVTQIARVLAHQYRDEVGPWRAYLRVISGQPG